MRGYFRKIEIHLWEKMVIDQNFDISWKFCSDPILGHSGDCYQVFWTVLHSRNHKDLTKILLFWVTHLCRVSFECVGKLISRVHCWAWYCGILLSINVVCFFYQNTLSHYLSLTFNKKSNYYMLIPDWFLLFSDPETYQHLECNSVSIWQGKFHCGYCL